MRRRVAVTGRGMISPCGNNIQDFSANLLAANSGICFADVDIDKAVLGEWGNWSRTA